MEGVLHSSWFIYNLSRVSNCSNLDHSNSKVIQLYVHAKYDINIKEEHRK